MRFLLNLNSGKVHDLENADGRCRIILIREEHKKTFSTLEEALNFPDAGKPVIKRCTFCCKK